jgi:thiol-disulfide isomerase/thioredoxin
LCDEGGFFIVRFTRYNRLRKPILNGTFMTNQISKLLLVLVFLTAPALRGQATESSVNKELQALRAVAATPIPGMPPDPHALVPIPDADRPAAILKAASDIHSLPAGPAKVKFADGLVRIAGQNEVGAEAVKAAADTLAQALTESPQQPGKDGLPPVAYMDLARLTYIAKMTVSLKDPQFDKAVEIVAANEADAAKADFTLKDLNGKKYTLSALKGKIVLINFWATQCVACKKEMQDLDLIDTHYEPQGLVILSITGDNPFAANTYLSTSLKGYHPVVLFDDGKAAKQFHVDEKSPEGLPRTFVFDRDGKLVAQSIDACSQRQFFVMLGKAGLQPNK